MGFFAVKCGIFRASSVRTDVERHLSEPSMVKSSLSSRALAQRNSASCGVTHGSSLSACQKQQQQQASIPSVPLSCACAFRDGL